MELEQIIKKPSAWTLIYDTITTNFEGKTIMIYVFHVNELNTSYINAWIVAIGPSKPKLWQMELEQITTKPIAGTLIYDTITINFEGKNTKCSMWISSIQAT